MKPIIDSDDRRGFDKATRWLWSAAIVIFLFASAILGALALGAWIGG